MNSANKSSQDLLLSNTSKYSLNLDFFELDSSEQKAKALSQILHEEHMQRSKPIDSMPIFEPRGKFFLKIYDVDTGIDHKMKIFDVEKSKYFWRSVG